MKDKLIKEFIKDLNKYKDLVVRIIACKVDHNFNQGSSYEIVDDSLIKDGKVIIHSGTYEYFYQAIHKKVQHMESTVLDNLDKPTVYTQQSFKEEGTK